MPTSEVSNKCIQKLTTSWVKRLNSNYFYQDGANKGITFKMVLYSGH